MGHLDIDSKDLCVLKHNVNSRPGIPKHRFLILINTTKIPKKGTYGSIFSPHTVNILIN